MLADERSPLVHAQFHDGAVEIGLCDNLGADVGLFDVVHHRGRRKAGRVVNIHHFSLGGVHLVRHVGNGCDDIHVELAEQAFLHDCQVQQAQETAAEAEAEGERTLGFVGEGSVVELEFLQRGAQLFELGGLDRIQAGEHHGFHFFEAGNGLRTGAFHMGDGISHLHLHGGLDARDDIADIPRTDLSGGVELEFQIADFLGLIFIAGREELHFVSFADGSVHHLEIGDDATERVEDRVEDKGLERGLRVPFGAGHLVHDGIQHRLYALARPGRYPQDFLRVAAQQVAHLVLDHLRLGAVHVNLVEHGDNLQSMVDGLVQVGNGLGLNTLRSIHHQKGPFAGSDGTRHLIREVHMAGRINQIEPVNLPVPDVIHLDGVTLDGNALLLLQVHVVQDLIFHFPVAQRTGEFQKTVCQGGLAMVDVCDDAKVADILHSLQR